jgi:hypothetical protein
MLEGRGMKTIFPLALMTVLACAACGSSNDNTSSDPVTGDDANLTSAKPSNLKCTTDTARLGQYGKNNFASLDMAIANDTVKLTNIVFSQDYVKGLEQEIKYSNDELASGKHSDGSKLTADEIAQSKKYVADVTNILKFKSGGLVLEGTIKPYVREPHTPHTRYPLVVKTAGIDVETFFDSLRGEGQSGMLLLPNEMLDAKPGKPDIEWDGTQGPDWDRFDCK